MEAIERGLKVLREEGARAFIKKASLYVLRKSIESFLGYVLVPFIVKRFGDSVRNIDSIYDSLDFAFSFQAFGVSIEPLQIKYEIAKLLEIVAELRAKVVLEIDTARGGTLFLFTRVASSDAMLIGVNLPSGISGSGYPAWKIPLYKSFVKGKQKNFSN